MCTINEVSELMSWRSPWYCVCVHSHELYIIILDWGEKACVQGYSKPTLHSQACGRATCTHAAQRRSIDFTSQHNLVQIELPVYKTFLSSACQWDLVAQQSVLCCLFVCTALWPGWRDEGHGGEDDVRPATERGGWSRAWVGGAGHE